MSFQEILDQLIGRVPEAMAATFNGEPLCTRTIQVSNDALQLLGAYEKVVRRHLAQAVEEFDKGEIEQVLFGTAQHWVLMMGAAEGCTLVLVMMRDGILGRARFEMERTIEKLNAEL